MHEKDGRSGKKCHATPPRQLGRLPSYQLALRSRCQLTLQTSIVKTSATTSRYLVRKQKTAATIVQILWHEILSDSDSATQRLKQGMVILALSVVGVPTLTNTSC